MTRANIGNRGSRGDSLNILYYGFHDILSYDDISMFSRMGHKVFSACVFNSKAGHSPYRSLNPEFIDQNWDAQFSQEGLSKSFVKKFDLAIYIHNPAEDIGSVIDVFADLPLVYRTVGQCTNRTEDQIRPFKDRVKIVRYSENEVDGVNACQTDAVIRFAKNTSDMTQWIGGPRATTFHSFYPARPFLSTPPLPAYEEICMSGGFDLFGRANEGIQSWRGLLAPDEQNAKYSTSAFYLYVHTVPTSYTLNVIEALSAGCPIIAPSSNYVESSTGIHAEALNFSAKRYDVPHLLGNVDVCLFDSAADALRKANKLWSDEKLRLEISSLNRETAHNLFSEEVISRKWEALFNTLR